MAISHSHPCCASSDCTAQMPSLLPVPVSQAVEAVSVSVSVANPAPLGQVNHLAIPSIALLPCRSPFLPGFAYPLRYRSFRHSDPQSEADALFVSSSIPHFPQSLCGHARGHLITVSNPELNTSHCPVCPGACSRLTFYPLIPTFNRVAEAQNGATIYSAAS